MKRKKKKVQTKRWGLGKENVARWGKVTKEGTRDGNQESLVKGRMGKTDQRKGFMSKKRAEV